MTPGTASAGTATAPELAPVGELFGYLQSRDDIPHGLAHRVARLALELHAEVAELRQLVEPMLRRCRRCDDPLPPPKGRGRPPEYCEFCRLGG